MELKLARPVLFALLSVLLFQGRADAQLLYKEKALAFENGAYKAEFVSEKTSEFMTVYVGGSDIRAVPASKDNKHFDGEVRGEIRGNKITGVVGRPGKSGKPSFAGTLVADNTAELIFSVPGGRAVSFVLSKVGPLPEEAKRMEDSRLNILKIADALTEYKALNGGKFPSEKGVAAFEEMRRKGVVKDANILVCPGTNSKPPAEQEALGEGNVDYVYFPPDPGSVEAVPIIWDRPETFGRGGNILFSDGRVLWFDRTGFDNMTKSRR